MVTVVGSPSLEVFLSLVHIVVNPNFGDLTKYDLFLSSTPRVRVIPSFSTSHPSGLLSPFFLEVCWDLYKKRWYLSEISNTVQL